MKPIAVLTNDISSTYDWLRDEHGVNEINFSLRTAINKKTNQSYVLIMNKKQAYEYTFSGILISPLYESLEHIVRSRIR